MMSCVASNRTWGKMRFILRNEADAWTSESATPLPRRKKRTCEPHVRFGVGARPEPSRSAVMPRNKTKLSCVFTNTRRGGERARAGECLMTSTAFDGGARDEVVYITCRNPQCRRSGCVHCWESVAASLEGWSRKKRTSFQMMQHPIFVALAKRAWRADAADTDVLQRRKGGGGSWTGQCPCCVDVDLQGRRAAEWPRAFARRRRRGDLRIEQQVSVTPSPTPTLPPHRPVLALTGHHGTPPWNPHPSCVLYAHQQGVERWCAPSW
jgi:hypothetical protein